MHLFIKLLVAAALAFFCPAAFAVDCTSSPATPCGALEDDAVYHSDLTLGVPASSSYPGTIKIANGGASGVFVTILNPSATTAYNFNLPATAGTSSYLLTSAGGSTSPMTWTSPTVTVNGTACTLGSTCSPTAIAGSIAVGTTSVTGGTTAYILYNNGSILGNVAQVPLTAGGTNASLTASNGGIVWSNASQLQILSGTVTAGQMLQSGSSATPAWSTATWPATTTINRILYSSAANTVGEITTGNSSVLVTSSGGVPSLSTALPNGVTAATNASSFDNSTKVATDAFVQNALLLSMATVPMAITTGTYSFASTSNNPPVLNITAVGGAITAVGLFTGGSGFAVGDLITSSSGNHDAVLRVDAVTGGVVNTISVVYGGTGYTTGSAIAADLFSAIPFTYLLSGALTGNVTIIVTSGTYLTASQQWYFANNTTGAHSVTVCVSNGSDACSAGRTAVIPQGTANSRIVGVQTDGVLNVDIASIVNAADLTGATLASGVTGSSLTSVGALSSGSLAAGFTVVGPVIGGTGVANNAANTVTFSGNYGLTLTLSNTTAVTLPTSGTLAALGTAQTWTAIQTFTNSDIKLLGSSTGTTTFTSANAGASNYTLTFPAVTDTLAVLGTAQTWTAIQTFTNSDIKLLGSSTGATTFTSANAGASNYTLTFPAVTDTLAVLGTAQTWTAVQTFGTAPGSPNNNVVIDALNGVTAPTRVGVYDGLVGSPSTAMNPMFYGQRHIADNQGNEYTQSVGGLFLDTEVHGSGTTTPYQGGMLGGLVSTNGVSVNQGTAGAPNFDLKGDIVSLAAFATTSGVPYNTHVITGLWSYVVGPTVDATTITNSTGSWAYIGEEINVSYNHVDPGYKTVIYGKGVSVNLLMDNFRATSAGVLDNTFGLALNGTPNDGNYSNVDITDWNGFHVGALIDKYKDVGLLFGTYGTGYGIAFPTNMTGMTHRPTAEIFMGDGRINLGNFLGTPNAGDLYRASDSDELHFTNSTGNRLLIKDIEISSASYAPNISLQNTTADNGAPSYSLVKYHGAGSATVNGDALGFFSWQGYQNGAIQGAASLFAAVSAAPSGNHIPSTLFMSTSNAAGTNNQQWKFDNNGHMSVPNAAPPTVGTCTGFSLVTGGDQAGRATMTSGTSCAFAFGTAFGTAPSCTVTPGSAASTVEAVSSTTGVTITFGTAQTAFSWQCLGV